MSLPFYGPAQAVATGPGPPRGGVAHGQGGQRGPPRRGPAGLRVHPPGGRGAPGVAAARRRPVPGLPGRPLRHPLHARLRGRRENSWAGSRSPSGPTPRLNPDAVYRTPLTLDDYLESRMISSPICLYDCDVPADGSTAIVVSAVDTVADLRAPGPDRRHGGRHRRPTRPGSSGRTSAGSGTPPARRCGTAPICGPPTSTWPSSTTGSPSKRCGGWRPWASAGPARPGAFVEGGKTHLARRRAAAQHVGRAAVGRAPPRRLRTHRRGGPPAAGRGRATARSAGAEVAAVTNVGGFEAGAALLTRW